jgi:hypothetical protein
VTLPAAIQGASPSPDSLRAVLDSVFASSEYHWVERPHPFAALERWWAMIQTWLARAQLAHPELFWVLFWGLVVVLVVVFVHGVWVLTRTLRAAGAPPTATSGGAAAVHGAAWYRREALRLAKMGCFPEAMQADFLALVLELDHHRLLRFHPSKTPHEYSDEVQLNPASRDAFTDLVRVLYGYAFARKPCGPEEFTAWREKTAAERYAGAH